MATTTATNSKTSKAKTKDETKNPAEDVKSNDPVGENADKTPAQRDVLDPPVDDGEAQAQAAAADQSANLATKPVEPIAAPPDEHDLSIEDIAREVISSALATDEVATLNRKNTELRLAIANRFPNLDVHDIAVRARRDDNKDGSTGPLVVEVKLHHGDWTEVTIDR